MKHLLVPACAVFVAFGSSALAQDPAPATGATTPATTQPAGTSAGTAATEKPKPLTPGDKTFVKKSLESMYFLMSLTDKKKRDSATLEDTKKVAEKINNDLNKLWGDIAAIASENNEKLPSELAGGDKSKASRLEKAEGAKFDKDLLKILNKESEGLVRTFESASKSAQDPRIKKITTDWTTTIKGHVKEGEKAEQAAAKAK